MSCRAGASRVYAVEANGHLAEAAEQVLAANGLLPRCTVLHKDARQLTCGDDGGRDFPGGAGYVPDLERPADIMVFEVGDSCKYDTSVQQADCWVQHLPSASRIKTFIQESNGLQQPLQTHVLSSASGSPDCGVSLNGQWICDPCKCSATSANNVG
jgi:hypothetical protein